MLQFLHYAHCLGRYKPLTLNVTTGLVNTEPSRIVSETNELVKWALVSILRVVSRWIIYHISTTAQEFGERHAYVLPVETFPPGSWRINNLSNIVQDNDVFVEYQESGWHGLGHYLEQDFRGCEDLPGISLIFQS
jgi:hypothetical protein